LHFNQIRANA